jgi:hypothetical protein
VQFDLIAASSSVALGSNFKLELQIPGYNPVDGVDFFYIVRNDSPLAVERAVASPLVFGGNTLDEGEIFFASGQSWQLTYAGGDGNDVIIAAVPEPHAISFIAFASLLGNLRRRIRRFKAK